MLLTLLPLQSGTHQVGIAQPGAGQIRVPEHGILKIGFLKIHLMQPTEGQFGSG